MIRHMLDTVGMVFSKIDSLKPIPQVVIDRLYIDYNISKISGNLLSYSDVFDIGIIMIHDDIKDYNSNSIFDIETFKSIPSNTKANSDKYSNMSKYILIPDIVRFETTELKYRINIIYNIFNILSGRIKQYDTNNSIEIIEMMPLILTSYIFCEYGITPTPASVLRVLLGEDHNKILELNEMIDNHDILQSLYAGVNLTKGFHTLQIMRDEECKIIKL